MMRSISLWSICTGSIGGAMNDGMWLAFASTFSMLFVPMSSVNGSPSASTCFAREAAYIVIG